MPLEVEVHALVRFDEREDFARARTFAGAGVGAGHAVERHPVRLRQARRQPLPFLERRQIVGSAGHVNASSAPRQELNVQLCVITVAAWRPAKNSGEGWQLIATFSPSSQT